MTSQINYSTIDALYPVAGKDNDSQGFRDNFNAIKGALSTAKTEITGLQANTVLVANLTNNDPVDNDLLGSSINNGYYNNFHGVSYIAPANGTVDIDITNGSIQVFTMAGSVDFTFRNWPDNGYYGKVVVHLVSNQQGAWDAALYSEGGGDIITDGNFPETLTAGDDGKHQVIEAWTYNNGAKVFVKYLGTF